ncbi:unnamed protein product [Durusdinium trenchii]|uniref:Uncharacterized protein n=1 Tax=Durusdinium trenchii TaxID=1381693 RepID=A0ABP0J0A9_9DINO
MAGFLGWALRECFCRKVFGLETAWIAHCESAYHTVRASMDFRTDPNMAALDAKSEMQEPQSHADDRSTTKYEPADTDAQSAADTAWADAVVPDVGDEGLEKLTESIMAAMAKLLVKYGSCAAFLKARFANPDDATSFLAYLHDLCAEGLYDHCLLHPLPATSLEEQSLTKSQPIALPLGAFSYDPTSSLKPDADHALVLKLSQLILKHGFITSTEPLLVTCPAELYQMAQQLGLKKPWQEVGGELLPHSVGFVKGKARMHTLLMLLAICLDNKINLDVAHSTLAQSLRSVHCHVVQGTSKVAEVIHNFVTSIRGELRKGPTIMVWVQTLQTLRAHGEDDSQAVIKRFNATVPKENQLLGQKAAAVKNLLDVFPDQALALIREHVQQLGWAGCCFHDDGLSSKKTVPGWKFRPNVGGSWPEWSKVTAASCVIMIQHAIGQFLKTDEDKRKKFARADLEKLAEQAAFVCGVAESAQRELPITDEEIAEAWLQPFVQGELGVLLEVQSSMARKDDKMDRHANNRPLKKSSKDAATVAMINLEADSFKLLENRVEYDLQCLRVARHRMETYEGALYHQQLTHRKHAFEVSESAVHSFFEANVKLVCSTKPSDVVCLYDRFELDFSKNYGLPKENMAAIFLVNWAALPRVKDAAQACQSQVLGVLCNNSSKRLGAVILPQFTYKKGQLYLHEIAVLQSLNNASLNFDKTWVLAFETRKDSRDNRPLTYPGRAVCGCGVEEKDWIFKGCHLIRDGRTAAAEQLAASNMQRIEDPDPEALPGSADPVCGARKYEQLGTSAYVKLLDACVEGAQLDGKAGLIICDLHVGVGDSFNAWLQKRSSWTMPTGYFGLTDDAVTQEWFNKVKKEEMASSHLDGSLVIPGYQPVALDVPADQVTARPKPPKLHVLVGAGPDQLYPKFPDALVKEWGTHLEFGSRFQEMMNQVIEEFGPEPMEKEEKKRTAGGTDKNPRPKKRAGIIKSEVAPVKIEEMPTSPCLLEVTLSNVRNNSSMVLQVLAGSTKEIWLLNRGNIEQKLTPGFILSGFGKGEYKQQSPASDREILYDMSGLPQVLFQSSLRPLEEVVNTERLKKTSVQSLLP